MPNGSLSYQWSATGPGTVTFGNANLASSAATFSTAGNYTLTLTVSDGELSHADSLVVSMAAEPQPEDGVFPLESVILFLIRSKKPA